MKRKVYSVIGENRGTLKLGLWLRRPFGERDIYTKNQRISKISQWTSGGGREYRVVVWSGSERKNEWYPQIG